MILPSNRLLTLGGVWFFASIPAAIEPMLLPFWLAAGGVLLFIITLDAARLVRQPLPEIRRDVAGSLPQTVWSDVKLYLTTKVASGQLLKIKDSPPEKCEYSDDAVTLRLEPQRETEVVYQIRPMMRETCLLVKHTCALSPLGGCGSGKCGSANARRSASTPTSLRSLKWLCKRR